MKSITKKTIALTLSIPMILTGCMAQAKEETTNASNSSESNYKIGITQYMEHPSLDEARQGLRSFGAYKR